MAFTLNFISTKALDDFCHTTEIDWSTLAQHLNVNVNIDNNDFKYNITLSALYSSKIEGNTLNLETYLSDSESPLCKMEEKREVDDLANAYFFAINNEISFENIAHVHEILTAHCLPASERGKFRDSSIFVRDSATQNNIYEAAKPEILKTEINSLFTDIKKLLNAPTTDIENFYYASLLHIIFIKIHPFADGNDRTARILEKWFLAKKYSNRVWTIQSEKFYWTQRGNYFNNLSIGATYKELRWENATKFLSMLANATSETFLPQNSNISGD